MAVCSASSPELVLLLAAAAVLGYIRLHLVYMLRSVVLSSVCLWRSTCRATGESAVRAARAGRAAGVSHYNYIVIGGRTAGCPLSEHSRVLLLERGGLPYGNMSSGQHHFTDALVNTSPASPAQRFI
ncbi:hypothetical protein ABZP36_011592 [Zizania latifolia]